MRKAEMLEHWGELAPEQPVDVRPVEYRHRGSTFADDGIRLTGTKSFIDSILSRLKDLLEYEGRSTRLQVSYQESKDRETGLLTGSWNCYIQVHYRGPEAQMVNQLLGRTL